MDYIKNKPFGRVESTSMATILPKATCNFEYLAELSIYICTDISIASNIEIIGQQNLIIDDITYQAQKKYNKEYDLSYFGNLGLTGSIGEDSGEDFLVLIDSQILIAYRKEYSGANIQVDIEWQGNYAEDKIMSEEYLPKTLTLNQLNYINYGFEEPQIIIENPQNGQLYCQLTAENIFIIWLYAEGKWYKTS